MSDLTLYSWYTQMAIYKGNDLIYFEEHTDIISILEALGFKCEFIDLGHTLPPEYKRNPERPGWWLPPKTLTELKEQERRYEERKHKEQIQYHRDQLRKLLNHA